MRVLFAAPYRLITVALAAALLVTSLSGCSDSDAEARRQAAEHRVRAESYLRQGQLRAAMIELQNAEQARPGHVETIALMGQAFHALGAWDKALPLFEKLQDAGKLDADSRAEYARVLLRSGRFGQAEALLADGVSASERGLRSQALLGLGQRVDAGKLAASVLKDTPDQLDARVTAANVHFLDGDSVALAADMEALAELDVPEAWLWRARLLQAADRQDDAITALSRALDHLNQQDVMTADRFEALRRMMNALIAEGRTEEAMGYSGILAGSAAGQLANQYDTAVSKIREGSLDEASALFEEILAQSPGHSGSAMALGLIAFQQQDYQRAQQYLSNAVDGGNSSAMAIKYLVSVLLQQGDLEGALVQLEAASEAYPKDNDIKALKGLALQRSGDADQAAALFEQVIENQPGNVGAHISLGQIALAEGDLERSERYFRQALAITPQAPGALTGLVDVADARGLRSTGMAELRQIASEQGDAQLWILSAITSLRFEDHEAARSDARQALALEAGQPRARAILGALDYFDARRAFASGDYDRAGELAQQAMTYLPDNLGLSLLRASAASAAGDNDAALAVARDMQARASELHHGFELEGDIHAQLGDSKAALAAYGKAWSMTQNAKLAAKYSAALRADGQDDLPLLKRWTETSPESVQAWLVLASQAERRNDAATAISAYEKAAQLAPGNGAILNNLAWQYQQAGDARAEAVAADAYAAAPDNPAIADTYGWILHLNGDHARAVQLLEQAAAGAPDNSEIQAHLAAARAATP